MSRFLTILLLCAAGSPLALPRGAAAAPPNSRALINRACATALPESWAGVYTTRDTSWDEADAGRLEVSISLDTLCHDASLGTPLSCVVDGNDAHVEASCGGAVQLASGCTVQYTVFLRATRAGDTVVRVARLCSTYIPAGCDDGPDYCMVETARLTKVGGATGACATTTARKGTWGGLKLLYR